MTDQISTPTPTPINAFERSVLEACLAGPQPVLAQLRAQIEHAQVSARTHTGIGAYVDFAVPPSVPRITPTEMVFGDVNVKVEGVDSDVSTILYIVGGHLHFIEFAADEGQWPKEPVLKNLSYWKRGPDLADGPSFVATDERDPVALVEALRGRPGAK